LHIIASETSNGLTRIYYHTELFVITILVWSMIKSAPT
jgi:hypothetical protein